MDKEYVLSARGSSEARSASRAEGLSANRLGAVSVLRRRGRRAQTVLALRNRPLGDSGRCGTARGIRAASADRISGSAGGRNPKNNNVILSTQSPVGFEARTRSVRARTLFNAKGATAPESKDLAATTQARGTQLLALILSVLLAVTMLPAAGLQAGSAYADEPAAQRPQTSGGDVALEGSSGAGLPEGEVAEGAEFAFEGLVYRVTDGGATLVGFEEGSALEGAVVVPERVSDGSGSATVAAVELAEGQVADGVAALSLPQTVERVETRGLAAALPSLASIEVSGSEGAYSSAAGMLFRQERGEASSDGSTTLLSDGSTTLTANAELLWAPPAMVVARIPIECRAVAAGAFADAAALETVMAFGVMESIAEGAFSGDQVNRVTIVVPITNYASASEGSERVTGSVQLSEGIPTSDKKRPWFDFGFDSDHIVSGAPFGEIDGVVAVSDEGVAEDRSLVTPLENGRSHLDLTPEEQAEKDARRGVDPDQGLSFSYQASMDLSVRWSGDVTATPARLEVPAYATIDGVKYQVTSIEPNAFEGAVFLESLVIPEGITTIGESAFENCSHLKSVELPSTLRTIDYAAFRGCSALESVDVPESVTWIGGEAFDEHVVSSESQSTEGLTSDATEDRYGQNDDINGYATSNIGNWSPSWQTPDQSTTPVLIGIGSGSDVKKVGYRSLDIESSGYLDVGLPEFLPVTSDHLRKGNVYDAPIGTLGHGISHSWYGSNDYWTGGDSKVIGYKPSLNIVFTGHKQQGDRSDVTYRWAELKEVPDNLDSLRILYQTARHTGINDQSANLSAVLIGQSVAAPIDYGFAMVPYMPSPGRYAITWSLGSLISYKVSYDSTCSTIVGLKDHFTVEDADKHLVDPTRENYKFIGWTGPGNPTTPKKGSEFEIDVTGVTGEELTYTAHWERVYDVSFDTGIGAWTGGAPSKITYEKGQTVDLPRNVQRTGFWFAGWYPTSTESDWKQTQDASGLTSSITADAYGDVTFHAVWIPMTYTAEYDVSKSEGVLADYPSSKKFIHPEAVKALRSKTSFTWPDGSRYDGSGVVSGTAPDDYRYTSTDYIDLSGLTANTLVDFTLDEAPLPGYVYQGWCTDQYLQPGSTDPAGSEVYTALYRIVDNNGSLSVEDSKMRLVFGTDWQDYPERTEAALNAATCTIYPVWATTDMTLITLEANQPAYTNNVGNDVVATDGQPAAEPGTQTIRFWDDHGFVGQAPSGSGDNTYTETTHPSTPKRTGAKDDSGNLQDAAIDTEMALLAPVRYGFQFKGWGAFGTDDDGAETVDPAKATLYIAYDESVGRTKNKEGFTLTAAGAALVEHDGASCTLKADAPTTWKSIWEIRTIEVAMRIPSPAVESVDVTGASTGADRNAYEDASLITEASYDDYKWYEGTSGETQGGSTSSWYIAKRMWNYGDVLEMPAFKPRDGYYSYDGWFDAIKPSNAVSTDKALEADPSITKIATFEALRPHKANMLVTGLGLDQGLNIADDFFLTGVDAGTNGKKELWLWVSPIRINVSSPIGIYLCQNNSYGVGVEPYVVGNDTRTQLESRAEFQVAMNSHDLQIVGVEAEDVVDVTKAPETDDEGNETGNMIDVIKTVNDTGFTPADGFCRQIIEPKYKRVGDNFVNDNYYYGSASDPNEGSRMFWVSPVPTATADQQGVIYGGSETAASAGGAAAAGTLTAQEEKDLTPDVNKRRYFGYGYTLDADDMTGVTSSTTVGGNKLVVDGKEVDLAVGTNIQDNTITDTLDNTVSSTEYKLGHFVLRARDGEGNILTKGLEEDERGLAYLGKAAGGADTYRFYYGLDMRRCSFDLAGLQNIIENSEDLGYNSAFDQPLLKVKFTFAAARNSGISYYSARMGETVDLADGDGIPAETTISIAG